MERIITLLGVLAAVLCIVFQLAGLMSGFLLIMPPLATALVGIGVITGR